MDAPSRNSSASTSRMDIDNPQSSNTTSHGKTVSGGSMMSTHASVLVDSVGPPSAEVCRAASSFP
jgi:hypothetical protein